MGGCVRYSIIVPVYKVEKYLERCVRAVLGQTFADLQLILVDDGSPDNCGKMCDSFAHQDERVLVLHGENAGVSAARNRAITVAQGDYLIFVDADDYIAPDFLEQAERVLQQQPSADLIQFAWRTFQDGEQADHAPVTGGEPATWEKEDALRAFLQFHTFAHAPWSKVVHRRLFDGLAFPVGVRVGEDLAVSYQLLHRAQSIVSVETVAYYYCLREGSAMAARNVVAVADAFGVFKQMYAFFEENHPALKAAYTRRYVNDLMQLVRDLMCMGATPEKEALYKNICAALKRVPVGDVPDCSARVLRGLLLHHPRLYFSLYRLKRCGD